MADDETTTDEETDANATDETTDTTSTTEDEDWKSHSRKHEREAKKARKEAEELRARLAERETADLSEHEKAIAAARAEATTAAKAEVEAERRHDRLEVAVTRAAARTFADTDDALIHLERAVKNGDVDPEDIFDSEGKVKTDALKSALDELLERKPHLAATPPRPPGPGSNDAGRGAGQGKSVEDMTVEDHFKRRNAAK